MKSRSKYFIFLGLVVGIAAIFLFSKLNFPSSSQFGNQFLGDRAYQDVLAQMALGPRTPTSPAHAAEIDWIQAELSEAGWQSEVQTISEGGIVINNVIAYSQNRIAVPKVILGAHFDTRLFADNDPDGGTREPVPGANDGASGVAVLIELARVMPGSIRDQVQLAFFDYEDQGKLFGLDWTLGSRAFAERMEFEPEAVVIVDMIGDVDLNIHYEVSSDLELKTQIWEVANQLGYQQFVPSDRFHILDDHTPFLLKGIPAVDLIDFDYPYWHTTEDTADKVSPESLEAVGVTLLEWLRLYYP
jgi:Zn-dependent M28 family amino/carboxypeptidase